MAGYPDEVKKIFADWKQSQLCADLEACADELQKRRLEFIEYGEPDKLTPKKRAALNSKLLAQALLHRSDCLIQAAGKMLIAKNVYGLALVARGHVEATSVLGHFCRRIDSFSKGNIEFDRYEQDIANGLLGAKDDLFTQAKAPVSILTCIENTDKYLNAELFDGEKKDMMEEIYIWLSEFAHPNFCSNKSAFNLDRETNRMIFRHDADLQESDFGLAGYMAVSAGFFPSLYDRFEKACEATLAEDVPAAPPCPA
ncbi:hypothetical protein IVB25_23430 [Bradyrhizobium sp. 193]|uniref:hypothetical protein n=1 Tax=Bradyrhizobium sp. 193 TaxID=2782661 RepID=UPI001FF71C6E|nr:hypothetical protein [Bradyrhizobium sp. 193]MCK1485561.1 hypothetical protein [Bradyrhizobium sp. 193]